MSKTVKCSTQDLKEFQPKHDSLVGIDSDGCVFDSMAIKQKKCFHGLIASHWNLQLIEHLVRECAEFVNLYSRWRGQNRFVALVKSFDFLRERPEAISSGLEIPKLASLRRFIHSGKTLSNDVLREEAERNKDPELKSLLEWSLAVNAEVAKNVKHLPPFHWALKSLTRIHKQSDAICVSQTPTEALVREWKSSNIAHFVEIIAGQELGTKSEHLSTATQNRYAPGRVLLIGDADGDRKAANAADALFYPINPGHENESWHRFHDEAYDRFLAGEFEGHYATMVNDEFEALLPAIPLWKREEE